MAIASLWTRLAQEEDEEFGLRKLELVSRDATVEVAAYLGPDEKQAFARLLAQAMAQARRGPQYS